MRKSIFFDKNTLEYTVKLKRNRWWWWLLLLLLPLLLLIRFEKDVYVKTIDPTGRKVVSKTGVTFNYHQNFLYDSGSFLTDEMISLNKNTDSTGLVLFGKLKYSVYSWIFKHSSKALITSSGACFQGDTVILNFHSIINNDTILLKLKPSNITGDLKVVDADDMEPLPGAKVFIKSSISGFLVIDSAIADAAGRVVFSKLPKCGIVEVALGSAEGYYSDSISNQEVKVLFKGKLCGDRILKLKPIRKPISFFVKDCKTKQGLAGVKATIDFSYLNKSVKSKVAVVTNINGIGKGVYDSARVVANIHISGEKEYYKWGELLGNHKVKEFIDTTIYSRKKRTFCLEPEPNSIEFINRDSTTNETISGVENYINIVDANNKTKVTNKIILSNSAGRFVVGIESGDKVTIVSKKSPGYEENNYTIVNKDGIMLLNGGEEERTIKLKPKIYELPPRKDCRVFVSDCFVGDKIIENNVSIIYEVDEASEYVGEGSYPKNKVAFPKAGGDGNTFDGIAIDKGTRVIIYSEQNFSGKILLDIEGPVIINNGGRYRDSNHPDFKIIIDEINNKVFNSALQTNFPQNKRLISETDMSEWSNGSMKIICSP
jgi:hypothetical protein